MRWLFAAICAVMLAGAAVADTPALRLSGGDRVMIAVDGDQAWAVTPLGEQRYLLSLATIVNGKPVVKTLVLTLAEADGPQPGPQPPNPVPDLTAFARDVRDQAKAIGDPVIAKRLAEAFEAVASQIAAETLTDPNDIVLEQAKRNREVVGNARAKWLPWFEWLERELERRADRGELITPEDHRKIWLEIAEGLKHV